MTRIEHAGFVSMTDDEYFADPCPAPSLNNSLIKVLLRSSPHHARLMHPRLNPDYKAAEKEERFDLGTAAHAIALMGEDLAVPVDADDWRTKEAKAQRDVIRAMGKVPLLREQHVRVLNMVDAIREFVAKHELMRDVWKGESEQVLCWKRGSIWCRGKLDKVAPDHSWFVDLKTTNTASPREFMNAMIGYGYHTQAEFYSEGAIACSMRRPRFAFLVCEDHGTHECYLVEPSPAMEELAMRQIQNACAIWARCLSTDQWPAYSREIYLAEPPTWALRELEMME